MIRFSFYTDPTGTGADGWRCPQAATEVIHSQEGQSLTGREERRGKCGDVKELELWQVWGRGRWRKDARNLLRFLIYGTN